MTRRAVPVTGAARGSAADLCRDRDVALTSHSTDPDPGAAMDTALGRAGTPEDIAAAVRFLAGDQSAFVTGEILTVSGGYRL